MKHLFPILLCIALLFNKLESADIEAQIKNLFEREGQPITGMVMITHARDEEIDITSFEKDKKPLKVTFEKSIVMDPGSEKTVISIYNFEMPAQSKGLYELTSISVKVGNEKIHSIPSSYQVTGASQTLSAQKKRQPTQKTINKEKPFLKLDTDVNQSTVYPGQKFVLTYYIFYNHSIDLTKTELPFIHPNNFEMIGDAHIEDFQEGDITIQKISQNVQASKLGTFELGPSWIEGYFYDVNTAGNKILSKEAVKAEAPSVTISVVPFFPKNQPGSFNGALGEIKVETIKKFSKAIVGEEIQLEFAISGIENLVEFQFPNLACQPGFSGFFQQSDLLPAGIIKGERKIYTIELIPLNTFITSIPSIEFSSFDLKSGAYVVERTKPIPIQVELGVANQDVVSFERLFQDPSSNAEWEPKNWPLPPLQKTPKIVLDRLNGKRGISPFWFLFAVPLGLGMSYALHWYLERKRKKEKEILVMASDHYYQRIMKEQNSSPSTVIPLMIVGLKTKLFEKKLIPDLHQPYDFWPSGPKINPVKTFLIKLESIQYGMQENNNLSELITDWEALWMELDK